MKAPENFEVMPDYCCYRLSGHGPLAEAAGKVIEVITYAREQGMRKLLIDTTTWTGHESPGTLERYQVAAAFTRAAHSAVKMAMVVRPEMMDPQKFEVIVARNRGLVGNVFDSETEALAWLLKTEA
jgi:2,4-dienoyl-CoA reductase-like NADH-dependent reductase (Old Yellow Enzyme family)